VGTTLWITLPAGAGYLLEDEYLRVSGWLDPVTNLIVGLMMLWYLCRVVTFRPSPAR
jgi:hypothetical protein